MIKLSVLGLLSLLLLLNSDVYSNEQQMIGEFQFQAFSFDNHTQPDSGKLVLLEDKFEANRTHKYFNIFRKWDAEKIKYLYIMNAASESNQNIPVGKSRLITNKGGNNSLIFTIQSGKNWTYDTLINVVHPAKKRRLENLSRRDVNIGTVLSSKLPSNMELNVGFINDNSHKSVPYFFFDLPKELAKVKLGLYTPEGDIVKTFVDGSLEEGPHKFIWETVRTDGTYLWKLEFEEYAYIYQFKIKK